MKLYANQLSAHLKNNLLPVYLITGTEPLFIQETKDLIVQKAKEVGFSERKRFDATKDFNWNTLFESADNLSLFGEQTILELQLYNKPTATVAKTFAQFIQNLSRHNILIILSDKLDGPTQKTGWFQAISDLGAIITIWPLDANAFLQWVKARLQQNNLSSDPQIVQLIAQYTEGNPLACAQEIEKLKLLYPDGKISLAELQQVVTDNARYDIFGFMDIVLAGNAARIINAFQKLRGEGVEAPVLLWAITREVRMLLNIMQEIHDKTHWDVITKKYRIWDKRSALIKNAIQKQSQENLHRVLLKAHEIDKMIKGLLRGNLWNELEMVVLSVASPSSRA